MGLCVAIQPNPIHQWSPRVNKNPANASRNHALWPPPVPRVHPVERTASCNGFVAFLSLQPGVLGRGKEKMGSVVLILQDCLPSHRALTLASTSGPASQPVLLSLNAAQLIVCPEEDPRFGCPKLAKSTSIVPVPGRQLSCMMPGA